MHSLLRVITIRYAAYSHETTRTAFMKMAHATRHIRAQCDNSMLNVLSYYVAATRRAIMSAYRYICLYGKNATKCQNAFTMPAATPPALRCRYRCFTRHGASVTPRR
ncbi:hypothetical protein AVEN_168234-1 [Araneus ventricosus]|uniref:Uncharacterized protein n=1 Tax=Araneus ventricosus TaxID=182803 RepID=A0A4Y2L9T5_ARAVE|nr:hypothetical protein AVEN_168234-1 [Araneus ventricosus]